MKRKGGILPVLKMEEGPQSKECRVTSVRKSKEADFSRDPLEIM